MKPETADFLKKARELSDEAQAALSVPFIDHAGRAAYLAGFHAAQALLFENTGTTPKTHSGVQGEFAKLVRNNPAFAAEDRAFLGRAYNLKAIADYLTGPGFHVTPEQAEATVDAARHFLATIIALLTDS